MHHTADHLDLSQRSYPITYTLTPVLTTTNSSLLSSATNLRSPTFCHSVCCNLPLPKMLTSSHHSRAPKHVFFCSNCQKDATNSVYLIRSETIGPSRIPSTVSKLCSLEINMHYVIFIFFPIPIEILFRFCGTS